MMKSKLVILFVFLGLFLGQAQVGIGTVSPDPTSILDIKSVTAGVLIPRMTMTQRDAIVTPAEGLQIYNISSNTLDIKSNGSWRSFAYSPNSNLVYVYSATDLPAPASGAITLDATKMYIFSGAVDISPNYIVMNGAGLRGTDPQKDQVISNVGGAVLRSTNKGVYINELAIVPASTSTKAFNFTDDGTHFCNIFSGSSVVDAPGIASLGVGEISGFSAITILQNYWNTANGVKIGGSTVGKFTSGYNFIQGISNGAGIELLPGLVAKDVDMANNYFIYDGQNGIKIDTGATVERGRLTTNMFRGTPTPTPLVGIGPHEIGWNMEQNSDIPNSRAVCFLYAMSNTTFTNFASQGTFTKIQGATTAASQQRFTAGTNKITYNGDPPLVGKVFAIIGAISPKNEGSYTVSIAKNGTPITGTVGSLSSLDNNQAFQITLNTEVDLVTNDYIEVFLRSDNGIDSIKVTELQFNITD